MFTLRRRGFTLALAGACVLAVTTAQARPTPAQRCQAGKNDAAGRYAACRQGAEAKLARTGNTATYDRMILDCSYRFGMKWLRWERSAARAGATCPDAPLDQGTLAASIDECTTNVATALAGGELFDCPATLTTCQGDVATCTTETATCDANLGTCTTDKDTCATNLGTCESDLAACEAAPAQCGNGTLEAPEQCDGANLNGQTCATRPGFGLGTLRCASGCTFDTSGCFATRFVDNGDGTVTDNQTGLQWEKKQNLDSVQNLADPHDADNLYTWSATSPYTAPDGTAFTQFLATLNAPPCFAGHCDWRLPTEEGRNVPFGVTELESILLAPYPCGTSPCIDPIFGPTVAGFYWSATTYASYVYSAWHVVFNNGIVYTDLKVIHHYVRAVRAGS